MLVQRLKGGRTHYATAVADAGNVTGWTEQREQAADVPDGLLDKVASHYGGRPNAGTISADGDVIVTDVPIEALSRTTGKPISLPDRFEVADEKLIAEVERLKAELAEERRTNDGLRAENEKLVADLKAAEELKEESETPAKVGE